MKWLIDCTDIAIPPQPDWPALQPPSADMNVDVPIKDNGEPLVTLPKALKVHHVYSWLGFEHAPERLRLRAGVVERLRRASSRLPKDFELVVIDGHRTREFQAELLTYYEKQAKRPLPGFISDPWSKTHVPPHTTGGAVDLTLGWRGAVLGLGTDFDAFLPESASAALESGAGGKARDLRRLLAAVLRAEGMTVIDSEWWHWSYGDQDWAAEIGAPAATYDEIT